MDAGGWPPLSGSNHVSCRRTSIYHRGRRGAPISSRLDALQGEGGGRGDGERGGAGVVNDHRRFCQNAKEVAKGRRPPSLRTTSCPVVAGIQIFISPTRWVLAVVYKGLRDVASLPSSGRSGNCTHRCRERGGSQYVFRRAAQPARRRKGMELRLESPVVQPPVSLGSSGASQGASVK
ncbi:hypothetical protein NHX12_022435, partial [Muraenolepis orangiensis]